MRRVPPLPCPRPVPADSRPAAPRRVRPALAIPAALAFSALLAAGPGHAQVTLREGTYAWKTWNIVENADHGIVSQTTDRQLTRSFKTLILENEYLVVTLLPEYGGRILSILYKPTGREQLFQNPVGFADGIRAGNFYYDWLMVLGGIFPTFPEPEHGKTYLLPWKSEVLARGPDKASVAMSITDDIAFPGRPQRFNLGVTGLACVATVSLAAGSAAVELKVSLRNDRAQGVRYEYWTCTSLAPGSTPGDTKAPRSTEIVVPIERYSAAMGTGGIDAAHPAGGQVYRNLAFFRNWPRMGIAYAEPAVTRPWWGVINHDNGEGIFRVMEQPHMTPGLKFWTWGWRDSYPLNGPARQFIELWAGANHEFFSPATFPAASTREWTERYVPTVGLLKVTAANAHALVALAADKAAYDGARDRDFTVTADIAALAPSRPFRARLAAGPGGERPVFDTLVVPDPKAATRLRLARPLSAIGPGSHALTLRLESTQGEILLQTATPITVTNVVLSVRPAEARPSGRLEAKAHADGRMEFGWREAGTGRLRRVDAAGRRRAP